MTNTVRYLWNVSVPMRDGVTLSADVYLPRAEGQYPAIIHRTPYDNTSPVFVRQAHYFAEQGYAFVYQDVRGRCDSGGEFDPFRNEDKDGYDTVEWIARQPWCTGKIGMLGGSYAGTVQWMAAREQPPHLTALVSTAAAGRWMHEVPYFNGKFAPYWIWWLNLTSARTLQDRVWEAGVPSPIDFPAVFRHRPLQDMDRLIGRTDTAWRKWLEHNTFDDYWKHLSLDGFFDKIDLPVLHITGWFDGDQLGEMYYYDNMLKRSPAADKQWLLIGPWDHAGTRVPKQELNGIDYGEQALVDINAVHLRFFDRWLKGERNGQENDSRVKVFIMGRNQWHEAEQWPLPGTQMTEFYLHSGGSANSLNGNGTLSRSAPGDEPADTYTYDPDHPTPSSQDVGEAHGLEKPNDNRFIERREEVLVFTSEPLQDEMVIAGKSFITLYAATDCVDTDFMAILSVVQPDGHSYPLATTAMRATYRASLERRTPVTPGAVHQYRIEFMELCQAFQPGQRIRVSVMSSLYPRYDLNPNTGARVGDDAEGRIAHQTLYHNAEYPSHLLLPVVKI